MVSGISSRENALYAHGPKGDPDSLGEVVMYWYQIHKVKGQPPVFTPHKIEAGKDTGVGTQFSVLDMNADNKLDLVLSNKKGTNVSPGKNEQREDRLDAPDSA